MRVIVTCVRVFVKGGCVEEFKEATARNHRSSVLEPGNLRFDVLARRDDPTAFLLYEAYETDEAARAHKETAHYLEWREAVEELMAKPREGVPYDVVCPAEIAKW